VSDDPRARFLSALKGELRCGPLRRRRVLAEIAAHLDDTVSDLEADGLDRAAAVTEALRRLGDVGTITAAFRATRRRGARRPRVRLRSPAWVAVGAMSLVTAWAAELPQASRAKATTPAPATIPVRPHARPAAHEPERGHGRRLFVRARHTSRP
jgi:hypothetical protein